LLEQVVFQRLANVETHSYAANYRVRHSRKFVDFLNCNLVDLSNIRSRYRVSD
jgi:hypothetical protein